MISSALILCLLLVVPSAAVELERQAERVAFLAAEKLLHQQDTALRRTLLAQLADYPLLPYLEARLLEQRFATIESSEVFTFIEAHQQTIEGEWLRDRWLRFLARGQRWADFRTAYRPTSDPELRCYALQAQGIPPLHAQNRDLWLVAKSQPDACDAVFARWRQRGELSPELVRQRALLAAQAGNTSLSNFLSRGLSASAQQQVARQLLAVTSPSKALAAADGWPVDAPHRGYVVDAAVRLARAEPQQAQAVFSRLDRRFDFEPDERDRVAKQIALFMAVDLDPAAEPPIAAFEGADPQLLEWKVRLGVAHARSDWVLEAFQRMNAEQQADSQWLFWRAAAIAADNPDAGREAFAALARRTTFWGFLAADRAGLGYRICPGPALAVYRGTPPALNRALEWFTLDRHANARLEWNSFVKRLADDERAQAAARAAAEGWHSAAIVLLGQLGMLDQYALRFPKFADAVVLAAAAEQDVAPDWIRAVARAESALVPDARSGAGALGLMQVTPATARTIARREGWAVPSQRQLLDPERNIRFGAAELAEMFASHGVVGALAAYNAGPARLARWRSEPRPASAPAWIATLPFFETRAYIPRVIAFRTIYELFHEGRAERVSSLWNDQKSVAKAVCERASVEADEVH